MDSVFYHDEDHAVWCLRKRSSEIKLHGAVVQRNSQKNLPHSLIVTNSALWVRHPEGLVSFDESDSQMNFSLGIFVSNSADYWPSVFPVIVRQHLRRYFSVCHPEKSDI